MSDKEKLLKMLEEYNKPSSFEDIVQLFVATNYKEFPASRLENMIKFFMEVLSRNISDLERAKATSKERATYLKAYLKGEMYATKESAEKHVGVQIENVQAILDTCS